MNTGLQLESYINQQIQINLTAWQAQADNAINDTPPPVQEESRVDFYVSLAGNLLWAATCFVDPELFVAEAVAKVEADVSMKAAKAAANAARPSTMRMPDGSQVIISTGKMLAHSEKVAPALKAAATAEAKSRAGFLIKTMSGVGATVGSGTLGQFAGSPPGPDDAKARLLRPMLARKRGELETYFKQFSSDWAQMIIKRVAVAHATSHMAILNIYDKSVWEKMFPTVPYNDDRFNVIRSTFAETVRSALADYNLQWQRWVQMSSQFGPGELRRRNLNFQPVLKVWWGSVLIIGGKRFTINRIVLESLWKQIGGSTWFY